MTFVGQVWLKLSLWFWGRRQKSGKIMLKIIIALMIEDKGQILIRRPHLSFCLNWAKKEVLCHVNMIWFEHISIAHKAIGNLNRLLPVSQ